MSLSKEYSVYCLSKQEGWVHTKSRYDNGNEIEISKRPNNVLLEIKFITEYTYPNAKYENENILYQTDKSDELNEVQAQYGHRPQNPYI